MSDELEQRAAERAARKPRGAVATLRSGVSLDEELDGARRDLDGTLPLLIDRERSRRDAALRSAAAVIAAEVRAGRDVDDHLTDKATTKRMVDALHRADVHDEHVRRFEEITAEKRALLRVAEPRTYGPSSPNSFYRDVFASSLPGHPDHRAAWARLDQYGRELAYEIDRGTAEGRRAAQALETRRRESGGAESQAEVRAMTSSSTSGGAFVTPVYLQKDYGLYRTYPPSFWRQSNMVDDPGYGLTLEVPAFTAAASTGQQLGENQGVNDVTPAAAYLTASLVTMSGEVDLSQQLFDRAGPVRADTIIEAQLRQQINTSVDAYLVTQAIANGGTGVTDNSAFSVTDFWGDIAKAQSQMLTAAGVVLPATHVFMQPTFYSWASAQVDGQGRPLMVPTPAGADAPVVPAEDGGPAPGATGYQLLGTPVFRDGNIANSGSNTQIVLAHMPEVFTLVSEPAVRAFPDVLAENLTVIVSMYALCAVIVRHSGAIQVVSGSAYAASPSFA